MGDKIRLTKKQINFIVEMTEIEDQEQAVEKLAHIMVEEKVDPTHLVAVVDKLIKAWSLKVKK